MQRSPRPSELPEGVEAALDVLRSPSTIRQRCHRILQAGLDGELEHFEIHPARIDDVVQRVLRVIARDYPDLQIPIHGRWNHFRVGTVDRVAQLDARMAELDLVEQARVHVDAVVLSVLLDAGAGPTWSYREPGTDRVWARSEGLAVATVHAFARGVFSSDPRQPLRADARALAQIDEHALARVFDVRPDNDLVGLSGRCALMRNLARAVESGGPFGDRGRPGGLVDHLLERARRSSGSGAVVHASVVLRAVLDGLQDIWPGRLDLGGANLGDVWPHPRAGGTGSHAGLVPLHKLSQWLTYSLVEPLGRAGLTVAELDALTGLAEYRNGGLLIDLGVLQPRDRVARRGSHRPDAPLVVEWRALTVALLDEVAHGIRARLGCSAEALPLARVLEGGTWTAGREVARERRPDGRPPILIDSDGTVF